MASEADKQATLRHEHTHRNLKTQFEWHTAFRDEVKNAYRTNYADATEAREVCVKSDFPSGYGGHCPRRGHNVLYKNTAVSAEIHARAHDPRRDTMPAFAQQKSGVATYVLPPGPDAPTWGTLPDSLVLPPWATNYPIFPVPNQHTVPSNIPNPNK